MNFMFLKRKGFLEKVDCTHSARLTRFGSISSMERQVQLTWKQLKLSSNGAKKFWQDLCPKITLILMRQPCSLMLHLIMVWPLANSAEKRKKNSVLLLDLHVMLTEVKNLSQSLLVNHQNPNASKSRYQGNVVFIIGTMKRHG
ncbi:hypothetical protein PISMIDRAFT_645354 [Pisolithus microcarpus 441]|uniref:Uncharacterized protein n=1 Tax=Pisolithus microcarpus 441 TaxID=765257 RepID=A0A0C9ZYA9_9AGAM|nr:hypothetical protein PISMIDRAFT_645354 [Pisolithus microcarpus 441]